MTSPAAVTPAEASKSRVIDPTMRRPYAIFVGLTVLFIFLQSLTAGEFIADGLPDGAKEVWTTAHGLIAYPVMVFALAATVVAFRGVRHLRYITGFLFAASVVQWLLGHAITTLGMDWVTPFHVMLAFVIYGLAIWLSIKSAALRKLV
jgi:hypothetical protein